MPDRSPLVLRLKDEEVAALFHYGTIVFVGSSAAERQGLLNRLKDQIEDQFDTAATIESESSTTSVEFAAIASPSMKNRFSSLVAVADAFARCRNYL